MTVLAGSTVSLLTAGSISANVETLILTHSMFFLHENAASQIILARGDKS